MSFVTSMVLSAFAGLGRGSVQAYEGDAFPETQGWARVGTLDAQRSLEDGWFVHFVGDAGQLDAYQQSLSGFAGEQAFFIEWRMETNAPSSLLDSSATPVVLSASGGGPSLYHFTITDQRAQLLRDTNIPLVFANIVAGIPHSYRLELFGDQLYSWYVDGVLIDAGIPESAYPAGDSRLIWGTRHFVDTTTRWDYIRFGTIPEPATALLLLFGGVLLFLRRDGSHSVS